MVCEDVIRNPLPFQAKKKPFQWDILFIRFGRVILYLRVQLVASYPWHQTYWRLFFLAYNMCVWPCVKLCAKKIIFICVSFFMLLTAKRPLKVIPFIFEYTWTCFYRMIYEHTRGYSSHLDIIPLFTTVWTLWLFSFTLKWKRQFFLGLKYKYKWVYKYITRN